jgi:hypothetical protein
MQAVPGFTCVETWRHVRLAQTGPPNSLAGDQRRSRRRGSAGGRWAGAAAARPAQAGQAAAVHAE